MIRLLKIFFIFSVLVGSVSAELKFPPPEFEGDHVVPGMTLPDGSEGWLAWIDVGLLFSALCLSAWLAIKKRSRTGMFWFGVWFTGVFWFLSKRMYLPDWCDSKYNPGNF